jgi:hypothetical protein
VAETKVASEGKVFGQKKLYSFCVSHLCIALLDPEDENLHFVLGRQDVKPLAIYRIQFAEYLICYNGGCHVPLYL